MDDGRYINNGWLQEMPDPITKLTWDNAALMSPAFAQALGGRRTAILIQIAVTETRRRIAEATIRSSAQLVIAALISPGHADNSITIPLGYGRKQTGPVGEEAGSTAYLLAHTARIRISSSRTARRSRA